MKISIKKLRFISLVLALLIVSLPITLAQELNLVYDANGNLITGDNFYREYNGFNQLVKVREGNLSSGQILEEYTYHPVEERIFKKRIYSGGNLKERILYLSPEVLVIKNSSGTYYEEYIYQDGTLVAQVNTDGKKEFVHSTHEGSVSLITDEQGNVIENVTYSPYGEHLSTSNNRLSYEGKEFDPVTGTYDFHFRQFNPEVPVWQIPDTMLVNVYDPQNLNRYMFERGNPYKFSDPTGHINIFFNGAVLDVSWGFILRLIALGLSFSLIKSTAPKNDKTDTSSNPSQRYKDEAVNYNSNNRNNYFYDSGDRPIGGPDDPNKKDEKDREEIPKPELSGERKKHILDEHYEKNNLDSAWKDKWANKKDISIKTANQVYSEGKFGIEGKSIVFEADLGKVIGTQGQTKVRLIIEAKTGNIQSMYPIHSFNARYL